MSTNLDNIPYDRSRFGAPNLVSFEGLTVNGTNASITALASTQIKLPFRAKVTGASRVSSTGGTAAGPSLLLQYSLAGTGSWTSIGTSAFGTDADGKGSDFGVTATNLSDGDQIRLAIAAGTADCEHTVNCVVELVELFE